MQNAKEDLGILCLGLHFEFCILNFKSLISPFRHPVTQKARVIARRVVIVCSCILAVALVTSVSVDVGPLLKRLAEEQG